MAKPRSIVAKAIKAKSMFGGMLCGGEVDNEQRTARAVMIVTTTGGMTPPLTQPRSHLPTSTCQARAACNSLSFRGYSKPSLPAILLPSIKTICKRQGSRATACPSRSTLDDTERVELGSELMAGDVLAAATDTHESLPGCDRGRNCAVCAEGDVASAVARRKWRGRGERGQ